MTDHLRCPECQSEQIQVEVTGTGSLCLDFARAQDQQVLSHNVNYTWTPESACSCMKCEWEGTALEATPEIPLDLITNLTNFVKVLDIQDPQANAERASAVAALERWAKKHKDRLSEPW